MCSMTSHVSRPFKRVSRRVVIFTTVCFCLFQSIHVEFVSFLRALLLLFFGSRFSFLGFLDTRFRLVLRRPMMVALPNGRFFIHTPFHCLPFFRCRCLINVLCNTRTIHRSSRHFILRRSLRVFLCRFLVIHVRHVHHFVGGRMVKVAMGNTHCRSTLLLPLTRSLPHIACFNIVLWERKFSRLACVYRLCNVRRTFFICRTTVQHCIINGNVTRCRSLLRRCSAVFTPLLRASFL